MDKAIIAFQFVLLFALIGTNSYILVTTGLVSEGIVGALIGLCVGFSGAVVSNVKKG